MTKTVGFKFNIARFFIFVIAFIALWICGDFVYSTFIIRTGFEFSVAKDIFLPVIFSVPASAFTQLLKAD